MLEQRASATGRTTCEAMQAQLCGSARSSTTCHVPSRRRRAPRLLQGRGQEGVHKRMTFHFFHLRPYRNEHSASRPIRADKHCRGQRVLTWVTSREHCAAAGKLFDIYFFGSPASHPCRVIMIRAECPALVVLFASLFVMALPMILRPASYSLLLWCWRALER